MLTTAHGFILQQKKICVSATLAGKVGDTLKPMPVTQRWPVSVSSPDPAIMARAAQVIVAGGRVAFPTETVYGLGAHALDEAAVQGIFTAKGRPSTDPLIVHLAEASQLPQVTQTVPPLAHALAERFWPGALTLILPRAPVVPLAVTAGRPTVAVRVPNHPVARALLQAAGVPVAAPSANRFARPSPTTADHVLADLDGRIEAVLDAGPTAIGVESTIVDVTQDPPVILRPGGLTLADLRAVAPTLEARPAFVAGDEPALAPGQLLRHYAPSAPLTVFDGPGALAALRQTAQANPAAVIIAFAEDDLAGLPNPVIRWASQHHPAALAHTLFTVLRQAETLAPPAILAHMPPPAGLGEALRDRLRRAAEGRVLSCD